jgi:hypothetical protein
MDLEQGQWWAFVSKVLDRVPWKLLPIINLESQLEKNYEFLYFTHYFIARKLGWTISMISVFISRQDVMSFNLA